MLSYEKNTTKVYKVFTFHASLQQGFQFFVHFIAVRPTSQLADYAFFTLWDGLVFVFSANDGPGFNTCHVSRIGSTCVTKNGE